MYAQSYLYQIVRSWLCTRGHAKSVYNRSLIKNNQVWARLTDDRVARDDRGRHIECGVYLTNHSREVRFEGPKL